MEISALTGGDLQSALPELAALRIEVFRDYPYLYDGSPRYEEGYLAAIVGSSKIVGCATGSALEGHHDAFGTPFREHGFKASEIFYCGESVLLPSYRGRGLGHVFFERREAHAKSRGYKFSAFCAVVRPDDHPLKPETYSPLDSFWTKRGYRKAEGIIARFRWKDIDRPQETDHPMQFWLRDL